MAHRILFGDDGSAAADLCWLWINSQRWGDDWVVCPLTAQPPKTAVSETGEQDWAPAHPRTVLDQSSPLQVQHKRIAADPRVALCEAEDVELMVIGPRGRGLLKAMHLGSTAEWLMHHPPHPLLIANNGRPVRTAVVCTDGSDHATAAAEALAGMPWAADVAVTVLAVDEPGMDSAAVVAETAAVLEGAVASVETQIQKPDELDVFFHVRDMILDVLRERDPDLVVHGTRGLSAWNELRAGSIATSLAAHAPCSVLLAQRNTSEAAG